MFAEISLFVVTLSTVGLAWRVRELRQRCNGADLAIDHLAAHLGLTPQDLAEAHYDLHPDYRPTERAAD